MTLRLGLDVGSTTIKAVVLDENDCLLYKSYERHKSFVREMAYQKICELENILQGHVIQVSISGSAGHGIAAMTHLDLIQEVFATTKAVRHYNPESDVVIELGGEDAKIIFLKGALEERMNSTCAGGTGAFIDQMASLLNVSLEEMDELSLKHDKLYPIASRCGVFAKTDIQPLINQGADKANIAASIFQAVVDQTITTLAQGRRIEGKVLFLGGPLTFNKGLRERFKVTLKLDDKDALCPDLSPYSVALGASLFAGSQKKTYSYEKLKQLLKKCSEANVVNAHSEPLFKNDKEYLEFKNRHYQANIQKRNLKNYTDKAYLGIDAGSTTTKIVLLSEDDQILFSNYSSNHGNPIDVVKEQLNMIYQINPTVNIASSAVTGYGEDLIQKGFHIDHGLVETMAHYTAARHFNPNVDFIIDIGGQDMKCFKIKDGRIDDIILNEACSSGCGSFLETFANSLGYDIEQFAQLGLASQHPVDLGSRCTVFMNSSVKEAQKNGASVEDISAGLARSVVKNALYKVIRIHDVSELGTNIVVQGGTFLNDTVLRSFEQELNCEVIRPSIAGLMGAYGAALYAKENENKTSTLLTLAQLKQFSHHSVATNCQGCTNHCNLTINTFEDGVKCIAGNKCEKPVTGKKFNSDIFNVYQYKLTQLYEYANKSKPSSKGRIGLPLVLNMFENLPFWHTFFTELGYEVVLSNKSSKALYNSGQHTIPSDTVCYPAKIFHGHILSLLEKNVEAVFYPALTYNFDEGLSDNCYNCPVVAYYPENIAANIDFHNTAFYYPYLSLNNQKAFEIKFFEYFKKQGIHFKMKEIHEAAEKAYHEYDCFKSKIKNYAAQAIDYANQHHCPMICLAGRPYHIDEEINHGISNLLSNLGCVVLSEDSLCDDTLKEKRQVLNQWTYHARLYQAAEKVSQMDHCELIQLVSFGCGLDSITSDEIKSILKEKGKYYTQIKIDEIDNLGAAKIRIRSLLLAMKEGGNHE